MRFISILTFDPAKTNPHDLPETGERMAKLIETMRREGTLVDTGGRDSDMIEFKVTRTNGRTAVTDGPFAESKEVVGGYAVLEAKDRDHATALTNRFLETLGFDATCYLHEVNPHPA
ncbi:MAG TPA: YciI family protein [Candidatus Binatia bacterium]|nr:YciI family protein [Candidatus Binatia bacterium]